MQIYDSQNEFCKITKSVPLNLFKSNCKNVNFNEQLNISYRNKFYRNFLIILILFIISNYFLSINKTTNILDSKINLGALMMICIILSIYYLIMTYLDAGIQGDYGNKGLKGIQGDKGPQGTIGPTGFKGQVGDIGENRTSGPTGPNGPPGPNGPDGPRGIRGERGDKGIKGYKGLQGDKGVSGRPGISGQKGPIGDKGDDNTLIAEAVDGDSSKLFPVFTYYSDAQNTIWSSPYNYYDVHNDISSYLKCDLNNSIQYENRTYNECKELCTNELDETGHKRCVGMYGDLDKDDPDESRGECFICPEKVIDKQSFLENLDKIPKQSNPSDPTKSWDRFVTGYRLKTLMTDEGENDSVHTYLTKFFVTNK